MVAVPMKSEYGPTLGRLLAPRWRTTSRPVRGAILAAAAALLTAAVGLVLTLVPPTYSHGGSVPFSFSYRGLYRVTPAAGEYVKVQQLGSDGALKYSYAVAPLLLPPYSGELSAELAVYASGYIDELSRSEPDFALRGEGKTQVNTVPGYSVLYTTEVQGRKMFARDVLLLPERARARQGVDIMMLTSATASSQITSPLEVASTGVLAQPLKSFTFG